jgi:hypothetical protein
MTTEAKCHGCERVFALQHRITFEVQGCIVDGKPFCDFACATKWAVAEVERLRGWLRRIWIRCGGVAGRLARRATETQLSITDDV